MRDAPNPARSISDDIPEEHVTLIGRIVLEWTRVENAIEALIWAYLGLDVDGGRVITTRLDALYKINMLRGRADTLLSGEDIKIMRELLIRAEEMYSIRSLTVHGVWVIERPGDAVSVMSLRHKLPSDISRDKVISTDMLRRTCDALLIA